MIAQFKSPCAACRAAIRRGDKIVQRDGKWIHECHVKPINNQLKLFKEMK